MDKQKFYITTTLPYVNADPHLGFALEIVQADAIARYHGDILGQDIFFNTGTDEHGIKIYRKAQEEGKEVQTYVDEYAAKFKNLKQRLGLFSNLHFIRTTDEHHVKAAQEFWKLCDQNGYIYKDSYKVKYCVGCELEKTDSELDETGHCLLHPNLEIEIIEEENYFFKFKDFQNRLVEHYLKHPDFVVPGFRFNEIKQFVESGLSNFSISRVKEKMPWGVPVPGDDTQVMYVWFDALINYISTLGWPGGEDYHKFWPGIQIAGKDNLRQQSAMWQAMLMAAGLPASKQIIIHGFITSGGQKMSKSLGNVADPYAILDKLQTLGLSEGQAIDALRYYLLREIPTFEDGDYTWEKFVESYNANLANGIGNLTSRILKMAVNLAIKPSEYVTKNEYAVNRYESFMQKYELKSAIDEVWLEIAFLDGFIQKEEPFKKVKSDPAKAKADLLYLIDRLHGIAVFLKPFLPRTSEKILIVLKDPKEQNIPRLFPRIL